MSRKNMSERFVTGLMLCEAVGGINKTGIFVTSSTTPADETARRIKTLVNLGYQAEPENASGRTSIIDNGLQDIKENGFNKDSESSKVTLQKLNEQVQDWKNSGKSEAEIKSLLEDTLGRYGITGDNQKALLDTLRKQGEQGLQDPYNSVPNTNILDIQEFKQGLGKFKDALEESGTVVIEEPLSTELNE